MVYEHGKRGMNCALVDEGSIGSEVGEEPCGKTLTYTSKWLMNMIFKLTHRDKIFAPSAQYKWDEMGPPTNGQSKCVTVVIHPVHNCFFGPILCYRLF